MDERDVRLIEHLTREPLAPLAALAKSADLTPNATRARLAKLREQGVLMGVFTYPHPALFGKLVRMAIYRPPERPVHAKDVLAVDDVLSSSLNHDGQVAVAYYADSAQTPPPKALDRLLGAEAPRTIVREAPPLVPPGAALSETQWKILEGMIEDGRATTRRIAETTGIADKVVARHRAKMLEGGHASVVTGILSNLAEGIVLFHLYAAGPGTRDEARVLKTLGPAFIQDRTRDPPGLYIFSYGDALGDALTARDRLAALPGIEHVELILEKEGALATDRMKAMCRARREAFASLRR